MYRSQKVDIHSGYVLRVLAAMAGTLLFMIGMVRWWPDLALRERAPELYDARGERVVTLEMIEPTRQSERRPAPQVPLPPIEVPDEVVLEEVELDYDPQINILPGEEGEGTGGEGDGPAGGPTFVAQAEEAPKPIRFVEPEYSREARRQRIRAQIIVEVRVDKNGRVLESRIVDRFRLSDDDDWIPVRELGYGVEEAVLAAADRWLFVPATHNGRAVESLSTLEFTIGG